MVLYAFRIGFRSITGDTDGRQQLHHEPMARPPGEFVTRLGQEDAAVGPLVTRPSRLRRAMIERDRMRYPQTLGDIGRTRLVVDRQKVGLRLRPARSLPDDITRLGARGQIVRQSHGRQSAHCE
jgi:hypothetical protein